MRNWFGSRHPSNDRLRQWLDTGEPAGVGEHVEQCDRCADQLERLELADQQEVPSRLSLVLSAALAPPDDLNERVVFEVERRERLERELELFAGLLTIGVETAQLMIAADDVAEPDPDPPLMPPRDESGAEPEQDDQKQGDDST